MAYRPLVENDRVKIMMKGHYAFGTFGTVVSTDDGSFADVKMGDLRACFHQKDLMVAHDALHGFYTHRTYYSDMPKYVPTVLDSNDSDECEYVYWSHDDLVERIKQLERQIEEIEK